MGRLSQTDIASPWCFASLIGLSSSYLNGLVGRYEAEEIDDIAAFLDEPWAMALYSDGFKLWRQDIESLVTTELAEKIGEVQKQIEAAGLEAKVGEGPLGELPEAIRDRLDEHLMSFLESSQDHLSMSLTGTRAQELSN